MSKAEEEAIKRYPKIGLYDNLMKRTGFVEGYHQAQEEIYEWLQNVSFDDYMIADEESYRMGRPYDYIDGDKFINDLKQAMKDE